MMGDNKRKRQFKGEVETTQIKERAVRSVHRGEREAFSNCSLGACWGDGPLLRSHTQVTHLVYAAKNKNC